MAEKILAACSSPGNFIFSLSWAMGVQQMWADRQAAPRKGFIARFADAIEDAQDVL